MQILGQYLITRMITLQPYVRGGILFHSLSFATNVTYWLTYKTAWINTGTSGAELKPELITTWLNARRYQFISIINVNKRTSPSHILSVVTTYAREEKVRKLRKRNRKFIL